MRTVEYRCRRCGSEYVVGRCTLSRIQLAYPIVRKGRSPYSTASPRCITAKSRGRATWHDLLLEHVCADGGLGICDLIGFGPDTESVKED